MAFKFGLILSSLSSVLVLSEIQTSLVPKLYQMGSILYIAAPQLRRSRATQLVIPRKRGLHSDVTPKTPRNRTADKQASANWLHSQAPWKREQFWPVVEQNVRGPDLVWRESEVLDTRVVFRIPGQVDVCPILAQTQRSKSRSKHLCVFSVSQH